MNHVNSRTAVEQALEQSRRTLPGLAERLEDAFLILDPVDERIVWVNARACELYGYPQEELVGRTLRDFSLGDGARTRGLISEVETNGFLQFETAQRRKDGTRIHLEVTAAPFTYRNRPAILSINRDVTDRIMAEQKLRETMVLNTAIIDSLEAHVAVIDQTGEIVAVNEAWRRFARDNSGWALVEPVGSFNYLDVCRDSAGSDPELQQTLTGIEGVLSGMLSHFTVDYACHGGAGVKRWFTLSVTPLSGGTRGAVVSHTNISERKLAEEALRTSEIRLKQILSAVPLLVYTSTLDNQRTTFVSSTVIHVTGFVESDFISKPGFWASRIHPEDRDRVLSETLPIRWKGTSSSEYRWLCADGTYKWFLHSARIVLDSDDLPVEIAGTMLDVTERKASEEVIRRSEERYRDLVKSAPDMIYTLSADGRIESLNPAFEAITGWTADEFIGKPFAQLMHPDDLDSANTQLTDVGNSRDGENRPLRLQRKSGDYAYIEGSVHREIEAGSTVRFSGIARDVTERHRAEADRSAITRYLELILDSIADGLYAIDSEGRCTMINRRGAEMLGRAPADFIGENIHEIVHGSEPCHSAGHDCPIIETLRSRRSSNNQELTFSDSNGTEFPVEYTGVPVFDGNEFRGVVVSFHDLTNRKNLQKQLEVANRLSAIGLLGVTVAHEFNNVLMGIQPFAEVLMRMKLEPRAETAARQIGQSVNRGKRITQGILRFTQPSDLDLHAVELVDWIFQQQDELRSVAGDELTLEILPCTEALQILIDPSQLHQALTNLIINARDATPNGGTIRVEVQPANDDLWPDFDLPHGALARISVRDSGSGIPLEAIASIFEPLFTTKRSGTGLGLAVVQQIVIRHGGRIFAESQPGEGAAFHLFLPVDTTPVAEAPPPPLISLPAANVVTRLLLVEDDEAVAEGLSAVLGLDGIEVEVVGRGLDVPDAIRRFEPEAVVLDVGLPDMSGIEVYRRLAEEWPELRVVFSTGHGDASEISDEIRSGRVRFLMKPYDVDALMEAIRETGEAPPP